jgi:hypothetical protein
MGYNLVSPADGKFTENITDKNVTGLVFANQAMPVATVAPVVVPSNVTAPDNTTTTPINTTKA